ncbi:MULTISPECIES: acetate uptake transporter [Sinomonas]
MTATSAHSAATTPVTVGPAFADPAALGLGAFAMTTFVLSLANANVVPTAGSAVLGLALFYGGLAQVAAGLWEFAKGNTFGATAFCSFGFFWASFWWLEINPDVASKAGSAGVGAYLLGWTIFTAYMTVAAIRTNGVVLAVFVMLTLTFLALTIGAFSASTIFDRIGGWLGIITAILAWYGSFATVVNATWKRSLLPVWAAR